MKIIKKVMLLGICTLCLAGCGKKDLYHEISYQDTLNKMEQKETFILYIGSSECSACESFKPTLEKVIQDYDIYVHYLDVSKLSKEELNKFETILNFGSSTPKIYFITEGEYSQYNAIKGTQDYDYVVAKMKKNGYIGYIKD